MSLLAGAFLSQFSNVWIALSTFAPFLLFLWRVTPPRADVFEAALPIRGREVVIARMLATLALTALPVIVWIGARLLRGEGRASTVLILEVAALAAWGELLPYAVNGRRLDALPVAYTLATWAALAAIGASAIYVLAPLMALAVFSLGIAATFAMVWTGVPDALQLASSAPPAMRIALVDDARRASAAVERSVKADRETGWRWAVLRSALSANVVVLNVLLIAMATFGDAFVYFCIVTMSTANLVRQRTHWMSALPFSRRARLSMIVVPSVVLSGCCIALGGIIDIPPIRHVRSLARDGPSTDISGRYGSRTSVSVEYWRQAPKGQAPVIVAPWGERIVADTMTVLGRTLYNPYTSEAQCSSRFEEWQFERATAAVYGRSLTLMQYDADRGALRGGMANPREWLVGAAALLTLGLFMLFLAELGYSHRLRPGSWMPWIAQFLAVAPVFAFMIADVMYRPRMAGVVMPLIRAGLRQIATALPANLFVVFVAAGVPVAAMYALLEWQFRRTEFMGRVPLSFKVR